MCWDFLLFHRKRDTATVCLILPMQCGKIIRRTAGVWSGVEYVDKATFTHSGLIWEWVMLAEHVFACVCCLHDLRDLMKCV